MNKKSNEIENRGQSEYLPAWAEVDLSRLEQNAERIRSVLREGTGLGAVLKADAYGHGARELAQALVKKHLVSMLIVGKKKEAEDLLTAVSGIPILILDKMTVSEVEYQKDWIYSVYELSFLRELARKAQEHQTEYQVHIRIDLFGAGMGIPEKDMMTHMDEILHLPGVHVTGIYTHLYSGYQFVPEQIMSELERFKCIIHRIPGEEREKLTVHAENSPMIFEFPDYQFDMVRSGTALFGLPFHPDKTYGTKPILNVKARVSGITKMKSDCMVSYRKCTEKSQRDTKMIVRFLLGYWDYPFLMTQKNIMVSINDVLYRVVDAPCMDHSCIEVEEDSNIHLGDEITILGDKPGVTIYDILERHKINLVCSERLCMLSGRLPKIYKSSGEEK